MNKKIDPYKFITELTDETSKDEYFHSIKSACNLYLTSPEKVKENFDRKPIEDAISFITREYIKLDELKEALELKDAQFLFSHIGHSMDLLTCIGEIGELDAKSIQYQLGIQVSALKDNLGFCVRVMNLVLKEID